MTLGLVANGGWDERRTRAKVDVHVEEWHLRGQRALSLPRCGPVGTRRFGRNLALGSLLRRKREGLGLGGAGGGGRGLLCRRLLHLAPLARLGSRPLQPPHRFVVATRRSRLLGLRVGQNARLEGALTRELHLC